MLVGASKYGTALSLHAVADDARRSAYDRDRAPAMNAPSDGRSTRPAMRI